MDRQRCRRRTAEDPFELEQRGVDRQLAEHGCQARELVEAALPAQQSRTRRWRLPAELREQPRPQLGPPARRRARRVTGPRQRAAQSLGDNGQAPLEQLGQSGLAISDHEGKLRAQIRPQLGVEHRPRGELVRTRREEAAAQPAAERGVRGRRREQRERVEGCAERGVGAQPSAAVPQRHSAARDRRSRSRGARPRPAGRSRPATHDGDAGPRRVCQAPAGPERTLRAARRRRRPDARPVGGPEPPERARRRSAHLRHRGAASRSVLSRIRLRRGRAATAGGRPLGRASASRLSSCARSTQPWASSAAR